MRRAGDDMDRVESTVKAAVVACLYAALVLVLAPISFHVIQVRVADALLLLPFLDYFGLPAVVGLAVGCAIANVLSPFGVIDIAFGVATNTAAGLVAWALGRVGKRLALAALAALIQSLVVATLIGYAMLHMVFGEPLLIAFASVFAGSVVSIGILGTALLAFIMKRLKIY